MSKNSSGMKKNLTNYGDTGFSIFLRKAFIKGLGYSDDMLDKKIVGITNTFSDYNPCHGNVPDLIKSAKAGILANGAIPLEFPTITIHESFANPTSMYLRNLMSMDTEEMLRAQPMDACVLIGGCDKTVPAQVMGGISADVPIIQLVTGPMLTGSFRGERVGACTDCRRFWASYRAEDLNDKDIEEACEHHDEFVNFLIKNNIKSPVILDIGCCNGRVINSFEKVNELKISHEIGPRRSGDVEQIYSDNNKINNELGWLPVMTFESALESAWKWEKLKNL